MIPSRSRIGSFGFRLHGITGTKKQRRTLDEGRVGLEVLLELVQAEMRLRKLLNLYKVC